MSAQPTAPIVQRQNEPEMLLLLRAAWASHARAQRLTACHIVLSTLLAGGALASVFAAPLAQPMSLAGFVWALVYSTSADSWTRKEFHRAALLQELFDVRLFGLPWNEVVSGGMPTAHEVNRMARHYRGSEDRLRHYYEIHDLPRPFDVFSCQLQNLSWGARIRRRYATAVQIGLIAWCATGLVVGLATHMTLTAVLLSWFVPSLGLLLLGIDIHRSQRDTVAARERVYETVMARLRDHARRGAPAAERPELLVLARQTQDVLLQTRLTQARVPNWFFNRFLEADRADFATAMRDFDRLVASATPPGPRLPH